MTGKAIFYFFKAIYFEKQTGAIYISNENAGNHLYTWSIDCLL